MQMGPWTMILVDTNFLVDFILPPYDSGAAVRHDRATTLLIGIEDGRLPAIMPEVVFHECFHVLVTRLKVIDVSTFYQIFRSILQYPGWRNSQEDLGNFVRALEIVVELPKLELSDAIIVARAEFHNAELATSDKRMAAFYSGPIWAES